MTEFSDLKKLRDILGVDISDGLLFRFLGRLVFPDTDSCWQWAGEIDKQGYGLLTFHRRSFKAHRLAWVFAYGPIPEGLYVCHHCDNPECCNPGHLFLGTLQDNFNDMRQKRRHSHGKIGERSATSKLTPALVREIRLLRARNASMDSLAARFKVGRSTIGRVIHRSSWGHVEGGS